VWAGNGGVHGGAALGSRALGLVKDLEGIGDGGVDHLGRTGDGPYAIGGLSDTGLLIFSGMGDGIGGGGHLGHACRHLQGAGGDVGGNGNDLLDDALDVAHEMVEVLGELGDLVFTIDFQACGEVTFALGDVPHALLDDFQGLDDGVAQQQGRAQPQGQHDQPKYEHHHDALGDLLVDGRRVHDHHLVPLLAGVHGVVDFVGAVHQMGNDDAVAVLLVSETALAHLLDEVLGLEGFPLAKLLGGLHGGDLLVIDAHHHAQGDVRILAEALHALDHGIALVDLEEGLDVLAGHGCQTEALLPLGISLDRLQGPSGEEPRCQGQQRRQGEDRVEKLLADVETLPEFHRGLLERKPGTVFFYRRKDAGG